MMHDCPSKAKPVDSVSALNYSIEQNVVSEHLKLIIKCAQFCWFQLQQSYASGI